MPLRTARAIVAAAGASCDASPLRTLITAAVLLGGAASITALNGAAALNRLTAPRHAEILPGTSTMPCSTVAPATRGDPKTVSVLRQHYHLVGGHHSLDHRAVEKIVFRLIVRKYAKECKLSKSAIKALVKLIEKDPPIIPSRDEDRSEWTEEQWQAEAVARESYKRRLQRQAFESIDEPEALSRFFAGWQKEILLHEDVERQVRDELHAKAAMAGLDDAEFSRFMRIRDRHKPSVHWRLNMHPNEIKKAEREIAESWPKIKRQALDEVAPESKEHLEQFLSDIEASWAKARQSHSGQRWKTSQLKNWLVKLLPRRHAQHGTTSQEHFAIAETSKLHK